MNLSEPPLDNTAARSAGGPRIDLVLMKANTQMNEHHADARISIHALQGKIRVHLRDQKLELSAGKLMALDYGIRHDVEALEESAFLITISWPGGTAEERHSEQNTAP